VRTLFRHLLLALNIAALVLAPALMIGAPAASAAGGMRGACTHCGAGDHAHAGMPLCGTPVCSAAAIVAPTPATPATLLVSRAAYAAGRVTPLSGEAPKTDPPPPRSILVL
jgi:hypothetical protein